MNKILLLTGKNGFKTLVNMNEFICVDTDEDTGFTKVFITDKTNIDIKETPEEVYAMMVKPVA